MGDRDSLDNIQEKVSIQRNDSSYLELTLLVANRTGGLRRTAIGPTISATYHKRTFSLSAARAPRNSANVICQGWGSDDGFSQNDREPGAPELVPTEYSSPVDSETFYFPTVTGKGTMMIAEDTLDKKVLERPVVTEPQAPESGEVDTRTRGFWKRHFILLWSVVVAMIIIIAVLGGIFGARSAAATSYSSSPSPSTHSPSSPASATPVATQAAAPSSINANLP